MINSDRTKQLKKLETFLGIKFKNIALLSQALTHSSYYYENNLEDICHNERMEFLGDAVLKILITNYLYDTYPDKNEGELSKLQAMLISDSLLAKKARDIELSKYMLFGLNEHKNGGADVSSNLSDALEALLAACYLDQGLNAAKKVLHDLYRSIFDKTENIDYLIDYKSKLQEYTQNLGIELPEYTVIDESGPGHDKLYTISATIIPDTGAISLIGTGKSKKIAEQNAAREVFNQLELF
ncbi:MAG: ribonuclease III [Candidatus Margulisbacteria bacterium GWF2_35_9]|nr:MAG: ribonuclease III [Candidatus Margulisbacteria bacterium GWF2_35_9]